MTLNDLIILCIGAWSLVGFCFAAWLITAAILRLARFIAQPWRLARAVIDATEHGETLPDEPVDCQLTDGAIEALSGMVMCPLCTHGGHGRCTCPQDCGHPACVFAHVDLTGLSEDEERFVNGMGVMP